MKNKRPEAPTKKNLNSNIPYLNINGYFNI